MASYFALSSVLLALNKEISHLQKNKDQIDEVMVKISKKTIEEIEREVEEELAQERVPLFLVEKEREIRVRGILRGRYIWGGGR